MSHYRALRDKDSELIGRENMAIRGSFSPVGSEDSGELYDSSDDNYRRRRRKRIAEGDESGGDEGEDGDEDDSGADPEGEGDDPEDEDEDEDEDDSGADPEGEGDEPEGEDEDEDEHDYPISDHKSYYETFSLEQEDNRDRSQDAQHLAQYAQNPHYARIFKAFGKTTSAYRDRLLLSDKWTHMVDNRFAFSFFKRIGHSDQTGLSSTSDLCINCTKLRILAPDFKYVVARPEVAKKSQSCNLCGMLYQVIGRTNQEQLTITRKGSYLESRGQRILRLCTTFQSAAASENVQVGFPILAKQHEDRYFELLRTWVQTCKEEHPHCCNHSTELPTRVLDVGNEENPNMLRLHSTTPNQRGMYVTLSHRWGDPQAHPTFCTYRCNIKSFLKGIDFNELPKTFQDAVTVTRKLGVRYLWIDSLCIIQIHQGCSPACTRSDDWDAEAQVMGTYYRYSYLTIAATSARGSSDGFLGQRPETRYVAVTDQGSASRRDQRQDGLLYICEGVDDFEHDVDSAELNQRGWVFQERALSRRAIHFAPTQTYWECGGDDDGNGGEVRCETLARIRKPSSSLMSDPLFPESLMERSDANQASMFPLVFERYTTLALTHSRDRPYAIAGLAERLASAFGSEARYGVFIKFLARCLLWRPRASAGQSLRRIAKLSAAGDHEYVAPSWSWMAYEGEIEYYEIPFGVFSWSNKIYCSPRSYYVEVLARELPMTGAQLVFDEQARPHDNALRCVIVGLNEEVCYILVITPSRQGPIYYERVGSGYAQTQDISDRASKVRLI
ncbi:heterokaryon incompatibility protein-domain-containing protein [Xylaria palmicola]|nr:heterokaryon incompatibility protein-domain-containing protein [Xylaria palmicola]